MNQQVILARVSDVPRLLESGYTIGEMDGSGLRRAYPPAPSVEVRDDAEVFELRDGLRKAVERLDDAHKSISRMATRIEVMEREIQSLNEIIGTVSAKSLEDNSAKLSVQDIIRRVADHYGITTAEMLSDRRSRAIARPRQIACWLALELTGLSLPVVGRIMGGRDHTTMMHARRTVERLRNMEAGFRMETDKLRDDLAQSLYEDAAE